MSYDAKFRVLALVILEEIKHDVELEDAADLLAQALQDAADEWVEFDSVRFRRAKRA